MLISEMISVKIEYLRKFTKNYAYYMRNPYDSRRPKLLVGNDTELTYARDIERLAELKELVGDLTEEDIKFLVKILEIGDVSYDY